jgi:hypothetical protein
MALISDEFYSQNQLYRDYNSGVELISIYRGGNAMSLTMLDITLHIEKKRHMMKEKICVMPF